MPGEHARPHQFPPIAPKRRNNPAQNRHATLPDAPDPSPPLAPCQPGGPRAHVKLASASGHLAAPEAPLPDSTPTAPLLVELCLAETCRGLGALRLLRAAEAALGITLGETTQDGRVTLREIQCTSLCKGAPCALVNGRTEVRLDAAKLTRLLSRQF
jgi:hypothetical protein